MHDSYMDYHPSYPQFHHLSSWLKVIFSGDYDEFLKMVEKAEAEGKLQDLLNRRESMLKINAIFHVIIGARFLAEEHDVRGDTDLRFYNQYTDPESFYGETRQQARKTLNVKNEHMKIFDKLLSLGVDVNVRDMAGFTPLHHCLARQGNKVTFKMAEKLIEAGANANAKNRFGENPLLMRIGRMHQRFTNKTANEASTKPLSLLLKNGADPNLRNYSGISAFSASKEGCGPISYDLFVKLYEECKKGNMRKEKCEGKESACGNCGKSGKSNKRCTGCYTVWYCSRDCQVKKWKQHGKICKEVQAKVSQKIQEWEPSTK